MQIKEFLDANPNPVRPGYVFALLPEKARDIYYEYVKQAADSLGLKCESFLDYKDPKDALRDIIEGIQKAEILIYDITDLTPNVMWELGVGLVIKDAEKVIVIREKSDTPLPFNIYSHRVSFQYDPASQESLTELHKTLREVMQKINRASSRKPPVQSSEVISLLSGALDDVENKKWVPAEALFQMMDSKEPENWYIYNQWGIMLRSKGTFEAAAEKFNKALNFTDFDDEKAHIYTELAVLSQMNRKYSEAEDWFRKAERADGENDRLYIAWAEYHDEMGDQFNAQAKIAGALGRLKYKEDDPKYKELMLRHDYYDRKIRDKSYKKTFAQFLRESQERRPLRQPNRPGEPPANGNELPYNISWEDVVNKHVGTVVGGEISNITPEHGIFVRLSRQFTGRIHRRYLAEDYLEKFSKNQRIQVRITRAFIGARDQRELIELLLA